jgi:RNA polymerase sigma factor (sigma-70 family)
VENEKWLTEQFEANRTHLNAVAYRMLGSMDEAEDAVQSAWLHLQRSDASVIQNIGGWLTTVVARVCLDMLRARKSRREESLDGESPESVVRQSGSNPEDEAVLADSVGLALLVVLDMLKPDERLAFVLHDIFAMPFEEIAPIVGRSTTTARQLASRARRRVRGITTVPRTEIVHQKKVVEAFLAAARSGDFNALLAVLDPDVVFRADAAAMPSGAAWEVQGANAVAKQFNRRGSARGTQPVLLNGAVGVVVAPHGKLKLVLYMTIRDGKIAEINAVADPSHLQTLNLAVLDDELLNDAEQSFE